MAPTGESRGGCSGPGQASSPDRQSLTPHLHSLGFRWAGGLESRSCPRLSGPSEPSQQPEASVSKTMRSRLGRQLRRDAGQHRREAAEEC